MVTKLGFDSLNQHLRLLANRLIDAKARLDTALEQSDTLATVYRYKQSLKAIWQERSASQERLVQSLKDWCEEAEASGIASLQEFARRLPRYHLASAAT